MTAIDAAAPVSLEARAAPPWGDEVEHPVTLTTNVSASTKHRNVDLHVAQVT
ncbi:MAG: hypothetical protein ACK50D_00460 [Burkholderiales bacterium]|nr:hypothetical protein [Nitrosomonadaceae bacterium]